MPWLAQSRSPIFTHNLVVVLLTLGTTLVTFGITAVGADEPVTISTADSTPRNPEGCIACHETTSTGFADGHRFGAGSCILCHQGRAQATSEQEAHTELIAFPGNLSNADQTCGRCHPDQVAAIRSSPMATGSGLVASTRALFGESPAAGHAATLGGLGSSPADSLLRKLCASCHLSQAKTHHKLDPTADRGGGCLACHINNYPTDAHPSLGARISDGRCFGCHSRSSRISLNYAGIAEVEPSALQRESGSTLGRLNDGRLVEALQPDAHHRAGMSCIDCHTSRGLMGMDRRQNEKGKSADILCVDCHRNTSARVTMDSWPESLRARVKRIPFAPGWGQEFLTTKRRATPLGQIKVDGQEITLYRKQDGVGLPIPRWTPQSHPNQLEHRRLTCSACHSTWAPQCYGCHTSYDPDGDQWDHVAQKVTAGRWIEKRWNIVNTLPTLGVTADDQVVPVIPGMIMTLEHPDWEKPIFQRRFAPIAPHTTGRARSCDSCHRSPMALGLGHGRLQKKGDRWDFVPASALLEDGLPSDAWTSLHTPRATKSASSRTRPFSIEEIERILNAIAEPKPAGEDTIH